MLRLTSLRELRCLLRGITARVSLLHNKWDPRPVLPTLRRSTGAKIMATMMVLLVAILNVSLALAEPPTDPVTRFWEENIPPEVEYISDTAETIISAFF